MPNPTFQEYLRSRKILLTLAVLKRIDDLLSQANAVSTTDALGNAITYTYDARGRVSSRTDALGVTVNYSYDATGRLLRKTFPDGTTTEFTYDAQGNIITARNANVGYAIAYDSKGRVLSVTDSNSRVVSYTYDSTGARTRMTTPEGHTADYNYDLAGRLSAIVNGGGKRYEFGYDAMGRRKGLALPNGTSAGYVYDNLGRLTNLTHKTNNGDTIAAFNYTHDKVGNRLTKTEPDTKNTYAYDKVYRLLQSLPTKLNGGTQENKQETFSYDAVGNRLTGPEAKETYSYDAGNELTSNSKHQYEYDKNGNLIKKTKTDDDGETKTWTYSYDFENRLVKVVKQKTNETKTISFKYDPFGRRIEKKVEKTPSPLEEEGEGEGETKIKTYTYVYDNEDVILEYMTKDDGKTETTRYTHGPGIDEPLAIERKGEMYYYHADGLGSITALTDAKQKVVESYTYTSFGELKRKGDKVKNTYTFTGREWDKEVKLYYYRARYYDAKVGRFTQKDPIGFMGGDMNLYSYVGQNPVRFIDPLGLLNIIGGVGGSLVGVAGVEGSVGVVANTSGGLNNIGFTGSVGIGGGLNISADVYAGFVTGDISNVSGQTFNINLVGGSANVTIIVDQSGNVIGVTIGYGPGTPSVGASGTYSNTGVLTVQDILDSILGKDKTKLCPKGQ